MHLGERFGSPQFVYDLAVIRSDVSALRSELPDGAGIYYSLKANPNPGITKFVVDDLGCDAEVSSQGEVDIAAQCRPGLARMLYTGPGKTECELRFALESGVSIFSIESAAELDRLSAVTGHNKRPVKCLLRVNAAVEGGGASFRMMGGSGQFGIDEHNIGALGMHQVFDGNVEVAGVHLYSVSNVASEEKLTAELLKSVKLAERIERAIGTRFEFVGLGGGFAAPYATSEKRIGYRGLKSALEYALDQAFPDWRMGQPRVFFESGRHLVGRSGTLVTRVLADKRIRGQRFVVVDAGVNVIGGMGALGRTLPIRPQIESPGGEPATVVGPLCTPLDVLARKVFLPSLQAGSYLTIPAVGAYGLTASVLGFTSRPQPVETVVDGDKILEATKFEIRRVPVDSGGLAQTG